MGTDVLGLGMALAAIQLTSRPAPAHRTYGLYRLEVLAALANGVCSLESQLTFCTRRTRDSSTRPKFLVCLCCW